MNIVYITQITNLIINNRNPLEYLRGYDKPEFEAIIPSHLLPKEILKWARANDMPSNALDIFIEKRVDTVIDDLKNKLQGLTFDVVDTKQVTGRGQ